LADTLPPPDWLFEPLRPIELYVLIVLSKSHNYPYNIKQAIDQDLEFHTTVFGVRQALERMTKKGWVKPYPYMVQSGRHERAYQLTGFGEAQLSHEVNRIDLILEIACDRLAVRDYYAAKAARRSPSTAPTTP
jgi:DNA-binding PadR family transcriptional regulator